MISTIASWDEKTGLSRSTDSTWCDAIELGFEFGDWISFLSAGREHLDAEQTTTVHTIDENRFEAKHTVDLAYGSYNLYQQEWINQSNFERELSMTSNGKGMIGDMVLRFAFCGASHLSAVINDRTIPFRGQNHYHQFEARSVSLIDGDEILFSVHLEDYDAPKDMVPVVYCKDVSPDCWVVHIRLQAVDTSIGILRLYRGPFRHLPALDRMVQRRPWLQDRLRYLRERSRVPSRLLPAQYVNLVELADNRKIRIRAKGKYTH
jgi:hypothetical protein